MVQKDVCLARHAVLYARSQGALPQAQLNALSSDMVEYIVTARAPDHLVTRVPCDTFGPLVPVRDDALTVDKIDAIIEIVNDLFVKVLFVEH